LRNQHTSYKGSADEGQWRNISFGHKCRSKSDKHDESQMINADDRVTKS
jgi:hypothetical protein